MVFDVVMAAKDQSAGGDGGAGTKDQDSLKYHLLGPSLTKAGQESVDQQKASGMRSAVDASLIPRPGLRNHLQCFQRIQILQ